jgi:hypothetical protein
MIHFRRIPGGLAATAIALFLAACGGGDEGGLNASPERGGLVKSPPTQLATLSAAAFNASLQASPSGQQLLLLAGTPSCGIDVRYLQYGTVGAQREKATATGAMYIPTGGGSCSGARPVLLYAHGTNTSKDYNIALLGSTTNAAAGEAGLVAALFAAHGYIVVAPNYAGYEASTLGYHPYLNADQQSKDMIDALSAARTALAGLGTGTSDGGQLFITGYSEGGFVAMATHRALQAAGQTVTASAGQSGPYAISMQVDAAFSGQPNLGGTVFTPLITTSWQQAYGNLYSTPADIYTSAFAAGIDTLLPSTQTLTQLFTTGKLPQAALLGNDSLSFSLAPAQFQPFFGDPAASLLKKSYADAVLADIQKNACPNSAAPGNPINCVPEHSLRIAAKANDLRTWMPTRPVMMCGGNGDPTVFFANAQLTQAYFQARLTAAGAPSALTTLVDLGSAVTGASDPYAAAKVGFAQTLAASGDATAQAQAYHSGLAPFCSAVARGFFNAQVTAVP